MNRDLFLRKEKTSNFTFLSKSNLKRELLKILYKNQKFNLKKKIFRKKIDIVYFVKKGKKMFHMKSYIFLKINKKSFSKLYKQEKFV